MNTAVRITERPRPLAVILAATLALLPLGAIGRIVGHFHVTREVAAVIVNLIVSGAAWELAILYPFIIPVEITIKGMIAFLGVTYAIGW
ncbi:MAG TPA: hypothetical protein VKB14_12280 [Actinomycetales bacterium]|nr:hypothetical protein [Actinomycetales bacterium]